ncbi:MAG: NADP oxidoreductase, partial [Anaerolineae bacterium]|nr:NADP oxidoreductase [Anaerolineae bacterium]
PNQVVPPLLKKVRPVNQAVKVDVHIPGCPPSADLILYVISELLEGRQPEVDTHFG